jgi:hypothetical protein
LALANFQSRDGVGGRGRAMKRFDYEMAPNPRRIRLAPDIISNVIGCVGRGTTGLIEATFDQIGSVAGADDGSRTHRPPPELN